MSEKFQSQFADQFVTICMIQYFRPQYFAVLVDLLLKIQTSWIRQFLCITQKFHHLSKYGCVQGILAVFGYEQKFGQHD